MFGKKKKLAQLENERQQQEELKLQEQLSAQPEPEIPAVEEEEVVEEEQEELSLPQEYESIAYNLKQEMGDDLMALPAIEEEAVDVDIKELHDTLEEHVAPEQDEEDQPQVQDLLSVVEQEEEGVYVDDTPQEDAEVIQPAKLNKLPNLIDYMLEQNISKKMKINVATLLLSAYEKYKDIPVERHIVVQCMTKVVHSIMQEGQN